MRQRVKDGLLIAAIAYAGIVGWVVLLGQFIERVI